MTEWGYGSTTGQDIVARAGPREAPAASYQLLEGMRGAAYCFSSFLLAQSSAGQATGYWRVLAGGCLGVRPLY